MRDTRERRSSGDRRRRPGSASGELHTAIAEGQVELLFQPQFSCTDGRLTGAEALTRWKHPQHGVIGVETLFETAVQASDSVALTRHIAARALAAAAMWPDSLRLSLNVTAADLAAGDFVEGLLALVAESGFPCERLTLEITEQALVRDIERSAHELARLADGGIRLALDDFGAGFCNFRYLKILPLDFLKLDRSMVEGIVSDERDLAVLRAIVAMADALGLTVIAEGIESEDQLEKVRAEGCATFQGFLRARPMEAEAFMQFAGAR